MNYFSTLEEILLTSTKEEKFKKFEAFYQCFLNNNITYEKSFKPKKLNEPSYASFMKIVLPQKIKTRKHFDTIEGKAILLHTIAHIEYSAIDLALDAALRFQDLPKDYYKDWLEVAEDEIRHFKMIEEILNEVGYNYGDFEVHTNLFEALKKTPQLLERMAVVPRYLEANGLDQNPKIMEKLKSNPDKINNKILEALTIILKEEVSHVQKGDRWFKYACKLQQKEPEETYRNIIEKFYPRSTKKTQEMNYQSRKQAGFSHDELKALANK